MKVTEITITGMHKVDRKTYKFFPGVSYFVGENGAGKSTILEAVQLALLGYIPGYSKTNESIMKHASGPVMSIEAKLDDSITIIRSWTRSGSSVKSTVDIVGYDGELKDLLGEVELPVFDFNEFRTMTSNKLKDWFITFLPSSSGDLDIRSELENAVATRAIDASNLVDSAMNLAENSRLSGLELVRALNTHFKEEQSYVKGQIASLEGTIKSLIRYDISEELDKDAIRQEILELDGMKRDLIRYNTERDTRQRVEQDLNLIQSKLQADSFNEDERVQTISHSIEDYRKQLDVLKADYADISAQINDINREIAMLPKAGSTCPYTHTICETAAKLADDSAKKEAELKSQLEFKRSELADCDTMKQNKLSQTIFQLETQLNSIQSDYNQVAIIRSQLESLQVTEVPTDKTMAEIDSGLASLRDQLAQIAANERYDQLSATITEDKFKFENELEIYKVWIKLTDANNLQTQLMNKPFEELAKDMSYYLNIMFGSPVEADFNLSSKANSFSFGLDRDGQYIEFDYLSSGERCLFTLALIMCILDKSHSAIQTILIDDILDHLDTDNATHLFESLKHVNDIQFILAGVKECSDSTICQSV